MKRERAQELLQAMAVQAKLIIDQMTQVAQENEITTIEFLGGALQFGVRFDGPTTYSTPGTARHLGGYYPAKGGALLTDYEWRGSDFECWPREEQREWLFGPDSANWPKTDYEED